HGRVLGRAVGQVPVDDGPQQRLLGGEHEERPLRETVVGPLRQDAAVGGYAAVFADHDFLEFAGPPLHLVDTPVQPGRPPRGAGSGAYGASMPGASGGLGPGPGGGGRMRAPRSTWWGSGASGGRSGASTWAFPRRRVSASGDRATFAPSGDAAKWVTNGESR